MPVSRTHRPKYFREVTGQEHITETLRKEVASNTLGHAYLFSGPRGVGKTTTARIFAKALLNEQTNDGEPPDESGVNTEVDNGNCIDLVEIDAASHTGVENVREAIIEHVRFAPARWKKKVYIIDECHMLSASSWNAMLKTLEEPPEYAFFILATTELHKVPETIKSRCQRFEFKRIEDQPLAKRIDDIAKKEKISIDPAVVKRIVHASDGCARDAESLLDQLASLGGSKITEDIAGLILPTSRLPKAAELFQACITGNTVRSLQMLQALTNDGVPASNILDDLLVVTRSLIRGSDPKERQRLEFGDEGERAIAALANDCSPGLLSDIALMLIERRRDVKTGTDPLFILELVVLAISDNLLPHAPRGETFDEANRTEQPKKDNPKTNTTKTEATNINSESITQQPTTGETEKQNRGDSQKMSRPLSESAKNQIDIHDVRKYWNVINTEVEKENRSIPFILKVCRPDRLEGNTVFIRFQYAFHKEKLLEDIKTKRIVEKAMRIVLKREDLILDGYFDAAAEAVGPGETPVSPQDIVSKVLHTFGGQVVE